MNAAIKASGNGRRIDIDSYRERAAEAVGLASDELTSADTSGLIAAATQRALAAEIALRRRMAADVLFRREQLPFGDIAEILGETESWIRYSVEYIERHADRSWAFKLKVDQAERLTDRELILIVFASGSQASWA